MVYMLLLKQLLVPPCTTFAEWRVEKAYHKGNMICGPGIKRSWVK